MGADNIEPGTLVILSIILWGTWIYLKAKEKKQ